MKKIFFSLFLIILLGGFLIWPEYILGENEPEEIINQPDKIILKEKDTEKILWSLIQKTKNKWIEISASPDLKIEEQLILVLIQKVIKIKIANYLLIEVPKEIGKDIIKATIKVAKLILTEDISGVLDEIEKITVEKAKKYVMDWLLQKEIRANSGNLNVSYRTYENKWENYIFPYIIVYRPIDIKTGEAGIRIYSSKTIKAPLPVAAYQWEGGIEELPPFIVEIKGTVEKREEVYTWVKGPEIKPIFNEPVPEFDFKKPGFFDRLKNSLNETMIALEKAVEKIGNFGGGVANIIKNIAENVLGKIKSIFSDFNLFRAAVVPQFPPSEESEIDLSEINFENLIPAEKTGPIVEEIKKTEEELKEVVEEIEAPFKPELTLEEIQEIIDDIAEKVDIISQKTSELFTQYQQTTGGLPGEEQPGELEGEKEEEPEEEETEEEEEGKGEEITQKFCEIVPGVAAMRNKVIFNEIAWMGSQNSANDEWIELKNISGQKIDLTDWQLFNKDKKIKIIFDRGPTSVNGFFLLERTSDDSVSEITADLIYTGALKNEDEALYLFDENCQLQDEVLASPDWPGGDNNTKRTMERKGDFGWQTSSNSGGTPKAENSSGYIFFGGGGGGGPSLTTSYPKILITEIQTAGQEDEKNEFVELYNPNENDVNLTDWYLQRKTKNAENFSTFVPSDLLTDKLIRAKDYFLIVRDNSSLTNIADVVTTYPLTENNTLVLKNPNREEVDKVGWGQAPDFETAPTENPPDSKSIARKWISETKTYQDTDDNSADFEIQEPTPKTENTQPISPPQPEPPLTDTTPPQVVFNLEPIQTSLSFTISFEITDQLDTVTPSGLDGFVFRWKEEEKDWQEDIYQQIEGAPTTHSGQKEFTGEDEKTYYFQIKAKDIAENESDWVETSTKISLPKPILITEIQIDSIEGEGGTNDDFIELYNPNDSDIYLGNYSESYLRLVKRTKTSAKDDTIKSWSREPDAKIPARGYYLWASNKDDYHLLVEADASTSETISIDNGIALRVGSENTGTIIDAVGWGDFNNILFEGNPALNPLAGKSLGRRWDLEKEEYKDDNDNSIDFEIQIPTPKTQNQSPLPPPSFSESPWPMYRANRQRNSKSKYFGPQSTPTLLWKYDEGSDFNDSSNNPLYNPPVIGRDGTVYSAISYPISKTGIIAINFNGTKKWFKEESLASPYLSLADDDSVLQDYEVSKAESFDGTIYYGEGNLLFAIDKDGNKKWEREFEFENPSQYPCADLVPGVLPPAVGEDGTIYVVVESQTCNPWGDREDYLYAISPGNEVLWQVNLGGYASSVPVAGADNTVYVFNLYYGKYASGPDLLLKAGGPEGIKWSENFGGSSFHSLPIVDSTGNIYFSLGGNAYCYNGNGEEVWQLQLIGPSEWHISGGGVAISGDGTIYFVGRGAIFALK